MVSVAECAELVSLVIQKVQINMKKPLFKKPEFKAPQRNKVRHIGRKKSLVAKDVGDLSWLDSLSKGAGGNMSPGPSDNEGGN